MVVTKLGFKSCSVLQLAVKKHGEWKEIMSGPYSVGGYLVFFSMHEAVENSDFVISVSFYSKFVPL